LYQGRHITYDTALAAATNPDDFALFARGITGTSEAKWEMNA
jgi:hypothetical protein